MSGDVNYNSVSLLLHFDGANGSTTFTDNSPNPKTVTANGDASISTAQSKFGGASGYFDGTGDFLTIPSNSDFQFGTQDFTIECWIYCQENPSGNYAALIDIRNTASGAGAVLFAVNSSRKLIYYSDIQLTSNLSFSLNTWTHIAITRASNTVRFFINGALDSQSDTDNASKTQNPTIYIGRVYDNNNPAFKGYIDDLRVTKGVARYTATFTPPTAAFPNCQLGIIASDLGPLGTPNPYGYIEPRALASDPGPLGTELLLAQQSLVYGSAPSMLGQAAPLAWHLFGRIEAPSMLGDANPLAWHLFARADVPSMLGTANPLATHDFTSVLGDAITYYVMDLTTPSTVVRVPISSWQATLQTGLSNYVQCVVPAVSAYVSAINAATQFKISRLVEVPGLVAPLTYEMASAPVQTTTFDQGPFRYTCTISGYSSGFAPNETPSAAYNRIMQGIRSISINQGGTRVRCSIDWLLRPSQRVFASSEEFIVSYINYYVGENDAYMEVGERA